MNQSLTLSKHSANVRNLNTRRQAKGDTWVGAIDLDLEIYTLLPFLDALHVSPLQAALWQDDGAVAELDVESRLKLTCKFEDQIVILKSGSLKHKYIGRLVNFQIKPTNEQVEVRFQVQLTAPDDPKWVVNELPFLFSVMVDGAVDIELKGGIQRDIEDTENVPLDWHKGKSKEGSVKLA